MTTTNIILALICGFVCRIIATFVSVFCWMWVVDGKAEKMRRKQIEIENMKYKTLFKQ